MRKLLSTCLVLCVLFTGCSGSTSPSEEDVVQGYIVGTVVYQSEEEHTLTLRVSTTDCAMFQEGTILQVSSAGVYMEEVPALQVGDYVKVVFNGYEEGEPYGTLVDVEQFLKTDEVGVEVIEKTLAERLGFSGEDLLGEYTLKEYQKVSIRTEVNTTASYMGETISYNFVRSQVYSRDDNTLYETIYDITEISGVTACDNILRYVEMRDILYSTENINYTGWRTCVTEYDYDSCALALSRQSITVTDFRQDDDSYIVEATLNVAGSKEYITDSLRSVFVLLGVSDEDITECRIKAVFDTGTKRLRSMNIYTTFSKQMKHGSYPLSADAIKTTIMVLEESDAGVVQMPDYAIGGTVLEAEPEELNILAEVFGMSVDNYDMVVILVPLGLSDDMMLGQYGEAFVEVQGRLIDTLSSVSRDQFITDFSNGVYNGIDPDVNTRLYRYLTEGEGWEVL